MSNQQAYTDCRKTAIFNSIWHLNMKCNMKYTNAVCFNELSILRARNAITYKPLMWLGSNLAIM